MTNTLAPTTEITQMVIGRLSYRCSGLLELEEGWARGGKLVCFPVITGERGALVQRTMRREREKGREGEGERSRQAIGNIDTATEQANGLDSGDEPPRPESRVRTRWRWSRKHM